jgi:hypothetical protein
MVVGLAGIPDALNCGAGRSTPPGVWKVVLYPANQSDHESIIAPDQMDVALSMYIGPLSMLLNSYWHILSSSIRGALN